MTTKGNIVYYVLNRASGRKFGDEEWITQTAKDLSLESSLRPWGRPKKGK